MKIFKCTCGGTSSDLEDRTQIVIDELFKKYPTGKIEKIESFGRQSALYTSILFETEPSQNEKLENFSKFLDTYFGD